MHILTVTTLKYNSHGQSSNPRRQQLFWNPEHKIKLRDLIAKSLRSNEFVLKIQRQFVAGIK